MCILLMRDFVRSPNHQNTSYKHAQGANGEHTKELDDLGCQGIASV